MLKNKKGSVLIYLMMLGFLVILLALYLAPAILQVTNEARADVTGLNCSSADISNYDKATCIVTDASMFYFIGSLIFVGGLIITAKAVLG